MSDIDYTNESDTWSPYFKKVKIILAVIFKPRFVSINQVTKLTSTWDTWTDSTNFFLQSNSNFLPLIVFNVCQSSWKDR